MNELKRGILLKKAKKFFEQFPDRNSTILKMKVGNVDTHWNVQRQKGQLQITEINSNRNIMTIKEDLTSAGGKGMKKPFEYDPNQKSGAKKGTGTVAPGMEPGSPDSMRKSQQAIRASPAAQKFAGQPDEKPTTTLPYPKKISDTDTQRHIYDIRKSIKANPKQTQSPAATGPQYQQAQMKMKNIRGTAASDFEPDVIKRATQKLSDQEFGQFYGFSKKSALQRQSTPPPSPGRIAKAGMKQYKESKIIREASPAFSKISAAFMDYMAKQNDHVAQSNFINTISREKMGLVSQQEKDSVAAIESQYLGQATKATDASTKQTPLSGVKQQQQQSMKRPLTQGVERKYRIVLHEADGDIKGIDQSSDVEQPEQQPPEELPAPEPEKSGEEKAVSKLAGQTIKSADVQFDENGGKLTLELASTQHPAVLEWSRTGRVSFHWKGQKYTIKK